MNSKSLAITEPRLSWTLLHITILVGEGSTAAQWVW